jgi:beta-mannan synthase
MFNETFVARRVIDYACRMEYPRDRIEVQCLDDSTDPETREVVDEGIAYWREQGMKIDAVRRTNRQGYKAGAMHEVHDAIEAEFIAIFDADFLPEPDFLLRCIPVFQDRNVGFVQGRWTYLNATESLFCRYQEICLNAHIKCEQYARFSTGNFFNFNGTGGVWRKKCMDDAGGWNARTLVEDMDLSLRAFLRGWQFVWRYDVECPNEIPSDYKAFRKQQRRWSCGPMQLWAAARQSVSDSTLPLLHKTYLNLFFFGVRMLATNVISFTFYSVLVPLMLLEYAQEEQLESLHHRFMPWWAIVWLPLLVTMSTMAFSPNSFHYMVLYVMYENAMSILKLGASLEGLLGLKGSMTWTVTQKLGGQSRTLSFSSVLAQLSFFQREMYAGVSLIGAAVYGLMLGTSWVFTVYFFTQGIVFVIFSLSLVEAFNLQPPSEEDLLGVATAGSEAARPLALEAGTAHLDRKPRRKSRTQLGGIQTNGDLGGGARSNGSDEGEVSTEEEDAAAPIAIGGKRAPSVAPPPLWRVLRANVVIFLYTLPINAFSIVLLYGLVTMGLSETIHTQWDDIVALSLSLVLVPLHMCWSLGNARRNWEDRRLARNGRLPRSRKLLQLLQLCILYLLLFLLLLVSMYSASATLQDLVERILWRGDGDYASRW